MKGGIIKNVKRYFKDFKTVVSLIAYLLLTAVIFYSSLTDGTKSALQSDSFSAKISHVIEVLTFDRVVLEDEGKNKDLYPEEISLSGIPGELQIGKTYKVTYELLPKKTYELSKVRLSSSNESVFLVDNDGIVTPISAGTATLTATDEFSSVNKTIDVTVNSSVYVPEITFSQVDGFSKDDNFVYFSTSNGASAVYSISFNHSISRSAISLAFDESKCDAVLVKNKIYFYPKTVGDITLTLTATYDNVIGKNQTTSYSKTITVLDKTLPAYLGELNFNLENTSFRTDETLTLNANYQNFASGLFDAQKRLAFDYDDRYITTQINGDNLVITPIKAGNTAIKIHYPSSNGIKTASYDLTVKQGVPNEIKLVSPSSYAVTGDRMKFTVIGDNQAFDGKDFTWSVSDGSYISSTGEMVVNEKGKVTVTAKHKTVDGFTVSLDVEVKVPYTTKIRKLAGHFGLFFLLSLFAFVVYYRLAQVLNVKKQLTLGTILSILAGVLTAGISELFQSELFIAGRHVSFLDFLINVSGFLLATMICLIRVNLSIRRARKKKAKELGFEIVKLKS